MEIPPLLLQFGGSLAAILVIYGLARLIGLGGKPRLSDDETVRLAASEVEDGFEAQRIAIGRDQKAALVKDDAGRMMIIKLHGNQFAGRILTNTAKVREEVDGLVVDCGETSFGTVRLSVTDPAIWADAINRL